MRRAIRFWPYAAIAVAAGGFAASQALAGSDQVRVESRPISYSAAVPGDAVAGVVATYDAVGNSTVVLKVQGLRPGRHYGAQVRERPCGPVPEIAGARFQNVPDPDQPSVNPAFANTFNEIWLDVRTGIDGSGISSAGVPWQFSPARRAGSVMLHERPASVWPDAGDAGPALACLTVAF